MPMFVRTVTDFSAEDKASSVKFCTAVYRRPCMEMESHIVGNFAPPEVPPEALNRTNRPVCLYVRWPDVEYAKN